MQQPPYFWQRLPEGLAALAARGPTEQAQLFTLADAALHQTPPAATQAQLCTRVAQEAMRMAWECRLLDPDAARLALLLHQARPFLPDALAAWARQISTPSTEQAVVRQRVHALPSSQHTALLHDWRQREPENSAVMEQGLHCALRSREPEQAAQWLQACALPPPVRAGLQADVYLLYGQWEQARHAYTLALREIPSLLWQERLGEAALHLGDSAACTHAWQAVLRQRPWHSSLQLRLDDVLHQRHLPPAVAACPHGAGVILLTTCNNAAALDATLTTLTATRLHGTPVLVLDNASTDGTTPLLRAWAERCAYIRSVRTECYIGEPAARNWLLHETEARTADWVVWLKDDAHLPPHWLESFAATMQAFPHHGLYGCRYSGGMPPRLYGQAMHMTTPDGGDAHPAPTDATPPEATNAPVIDAFGASFLPRSLPAWDTGQHTYCRPCANVPAACQLLRRSAIAAVGGYDLRFSPQAGEDADYQLRLCQQGLWPLYDGWLCAQRTTADASPFQEAPAAPETLRPETGNIFKLRGKYADSVCATLHQQEQTLLLNDLMRRMPDAE